MPADTPGRRLKVLAGGLEQLGTHCEAESARVSAVAAPLFVAVSTWQSCAGTVNIAALAAGKNLAAIAQRIGTRGADYAKAGSMYTRNDEDSAGEFRGLVS